MTIAFQPPKALQKKLLESDVSLYLVATGAGAGIQSHLWAPPGASSFFMGASFPYGAHELVDFLGFDPKAYENGYCCPETALDMAAEAYIRAQSRSYLDGQTKKVAIGVGVTAAVASLKPHRSDHRVHISIVSDLAPPILVSFTLVKGTGADDRNADELEVVAETLGQLEVLLGLPRTMPALLEQSQSYPELKETLRKRILSKPFFHANGHRGSFALQEPYHRRHDIILFPGSFNPLHDGHRKMASIIQERCSSEIVFNICVDHVHKAGLTATDILTRAAIFRAEVIRSKKETMAFGEAKRDQHLFFSEGDPLFIDKIEKRQDTIWIIGADTMDTLLDPKWGPSTYGVIQKIEDTNTDFRVFPAIMPDGTRVTVDTVIAKFGLGDRESNYFMKMNHEIPPIRSTLLREGAVKP